MSPSNATRRPPRSRYRTSTRPATAAASHPVNSDPDATRRAFCAWWHGIAGEIHRAIEELHNPSSPIALALTVAEWNDVQDTLLEVSNELASGEPRPWADPPFVAFADVLKAAGKQ